MWYDIRHGGETVSTGYAVRQVARRRMKTREHRAYKAYFGPQGSTAHLHFLIDLKSARLMRTFLIQHLASGPLPAGAQITHSLS
jgi:hypothetical protein